MVFVYHPDALERMSQVEGRDWGRRQERASDPFSFKCYLREWWLVKGLGWVSEDPICTENGDGYIYGARSNRYKVMGNGEVVLVSLYSDKNHVEAAIASGFNVL